MARTNLTNAALTDAEVRDLQNRWEGTHTLEERLLSAYLRQNTCWHCHAELLVDDHPNCTDCPEHGARVSQRD